MRTLRLLAAIQISVLALALPAPLLGQTVVPLAPFSSVELRNGVRAILRHGPTQRVTLLKGSPDHTRIMIADGGRLVIDKCAGRCPQGYQLEVEIVTPNIAGITVAHGGITQSRGTFPRQAEIVATVSNGGTIDIRSMPVDRVAASVEQGGRIFTVPQTTLAASVFQGGNITYWGDARVEQSVRHGGVVERGTAAEADKPISEEVTPSVPALPSVQSLRPIQPIRKE